MSFVIIVVPLVKLRWLFAFAQDTKLDHLVDQLNEYGRHGIPRLPHLLTFEADEDTEEALYRCVFVRAHVIRVFVFAHSSKQFSLVFGERAFLAAFYVSVTFCLMVLFARNDFLIFFTIIFIIIVAWKKIGNIL